MKTHPIMLDLRDRTAVVIGAGSIAMRKVGSLLAAGARVLLVSPETPPDLPAGATHRAERYKPEQLDGAAIVFAATDDREVNARIAADARARGLLVNAVDQPDDCDFFAAATAEYGDVIVAVGTGGSAPRLAGWLRDRIARAVPDRIEAYAAALRQCRDELHARCDDSARRMAIMKSLVSDELYDAFCTEGPAALRRHVESQT